MTGIRWTVPKKKKLARVIAVIALGQVHHAARIIEDLEPDSAAYSHAELVAAARAQMGIRGTTFRQRLASRAHRDGFLFECISWIAARQNLDARSFLKDPHLDATSHGLDGLIVTLHAEEPKVVNATICEDKCTAMARTLFRRDVLRAFGEHHANKRGRDLVANAAALIRESGLDGTRATKAAARVLDPKYRSYRAALTTVGVDDAHARAALFKGYSKLDGIEQRQRIGVTFVIDSHVRRWFDGLARHVIAALDDFEQQFAANDEDDDV